MRSFLAQVEARTSTYRWLGFSDWLGGEAEGQMLATLWWAFGSVRLARQVRQAAEAVGPWLLDVLADRQRLGLTLTLERDAALLPRLAQEARIRPLAAPELDRAPSWLAWLLRGELLRLVRLAEAPPCWLAGPAWDARYQALGVTLLRLRQGYTALERAVGSEAAEARLAEAAAAARRQATQTAQAA